MTGTCFVIDSFFVAVEKVNEVISAAIRQIQKTPAYLNAKPSLDHRITKWFGLEGTLKPIQSQSLLWAGCPPADQAARAPCSLALKVSKDGASTASLSSLCQCLTTLSVKNFSSEFPLFNFKAIPPCAITIGPCKVVFHLVYKRHLNTERSQ